MKMKDWRQVDQLDDVEQPESLEYIRAKFGAYKMTIKGVQNFLYFKCTKNTCHFQLRWEKRNGKLQALREHNHEFALGRTKKYQKKLKIVKKEMQRKEPNTKELSKNTTKDAIGPSLKDKDMMINQSTVSSPNIQENFVMAKKNNFKLAKSSTKENKLKNDPLLLCRLDLNKPKWWNYLGKILLSTEQIEAYLANRKVQRCQKQFNTLKKKQESIDHSNELISPAVSNELVKNVAGPSSISNDKMPVNTHSNFATIQCDVNTVRSTIAKTILHLQCNKCCGLLDVNRCYRGHALCLTCCGHLECIQSAE